MMKRKIFLALFPLCLSILSYSISMGKINNTRLSSNGIGDLLIYPLFYASNRGFSRVVVTNNSARFGVVALVTLKSSGCSEILANTLIYLTPMDSWVGYITDEGETPSLVSYDDSSVLSGPTVASEENPMKIPLATPQNPTDVSNIGYLEVKTLAYVDTFYTDPSNRTITFPYIMRKAGFTEPHMFMQWLFQEDQDRYQDIAYFNNTDNFTGLIFPADEHTDFHGWNPTVSGGMTLEDFEDGALSGTMEIVVPGYGSASYRAVAVKDYIMLGDDVLKKENGFRYSRNFNSNYKPKIEEAAYLDVVGYIDFLDYALMVSKMNFHYYADRISSSAVAFLTFPTKQLTYDSTTGKCIANKHTSGVWHEGMVLQEQGLDIYIVSDRGEIRKCAFSPCIWSDTAMISITKTRFGFDPFIYKSGSVIVDVYSKSDQEMHVPLKNITVGIPWKDVHALPALGLIAILGTPSGLEIYKPTRIGLLYYYYLLQPETVQHPISSEEEDNTEENINLPFPFLQH